MRIRPTSSCLRKERVKKLRSRQEQEDKNCKEAIDGFDSSEAEKTTVTRVKQNIEASDTDSNGLTAEEKAIMAEYKESQHELKKAIR